jgi:predicted O-methyltransferase YrrM
LSNEGIVLGGGGAIELIYFFCRQVKPNNVLETGFAAGWSSYAILKALEKNEKGNLDSSDLPYFRIENSEKYIGILVPSFLKESGRWNLELRGDRNNLDIFLQGDKRYDIVHYDSDKRKVSRINFFNRIEKWLSSNAVIIMDDIEDNFAFRDYVEEKNLNYRVFKYEGKYIGLIEIEDRSHLNC